MYFYEINHLIFYTSEVSQAKFHLILTNKKILILGLGNEILSDDGIGIRIVNDISEWVNDSFVQFRTISTGGLDVMEIIRDFEKVIIVDAVKTSGGRPGNVYSFKASEFIETSNLSNLHDIDFITALRLSKMLEINIPADLNIIAVEIKEDREFSERFTPEIEKSYPVILQKVQALITKILTE